MRRKKARSVESDLLEALARLRAGTPRSKILQERSTKRGVAINPVTVALEAGRSRTLIGSDQCAYPHVRELVLQAGGNRRIPNTNKVDIVTKLRGVIGALENELAAAQTLLAAQRITIEALGANRD